MGCVEKGRRGDGEGVEGITRAVAPGFDNTGWTWPYCVLYVLLLYCVLIQTIQQAVGPREEGV